ncbi:hypothetical protein [Elizabethkingia anophelis]|uniref:hypothetical protein n=1 Tax=Elizabethkingia anophelis TaxID=1117645 RepID=UPI0038915A5A
MKKKEEEKLEYVPPTITICIIEMEQGIATGSATTSPNDNTSDITDEWEDGSNTTGEIIWD